MFRQLLLQEMAQFSTRRVWLLSRNYIDHQARLSWLLLTQEHDASPHIGVPTQHCLDLSQLDTMAAQLHLAVCPTQKFHLPVSSVAGQISRLVGSCSLLCTKRIGYKAFFSLLWLVQVPGS